MPSVATSTTSESPNSTIATALSLHDKGYCIIPLRPGTKIPAVKWKVYQQTRPKRETVESWFTQWPDYDIGIVTGPVSGVMCLDYDKEPYPDNDDAYIETRRGRHYYYRYHDGDLHGLQVKPGIDIPRLAKFYATPVINESRIPLQPTYVPKAGGDFGEWDDKHPPAFEDITGCNFIQWFRAKRADPRWDGRYPLARAYASNVQRTRDPDTDLGPGYRHTDAILASTSRPISCEAIAQHWRCPMMNDYGFCTKEAGITTPYGLAKRRQK